MTIKQSKLVRWKTFLIKGLGISSFVMVIFLLSFSVQQDAKDMKIVASVHAENKVEEKINPRNQSKGKNLKKVQGVTDETNVSNKRILSPERKPPVSALSSVKTITKNTEDKKKMELQNKTENSKCRCHVQDNSCNCSPKPTTLLKHEKTKVVEDKDTKNDSPKQIPDQVKTKMEPKNVKNNQTVKTGTKLSTYKNTSSQPNKQPVSNWSFNKKNITNMDNKAQMKLQSQDKTENSMCSCHIQDNSCNCSQKPTTLQKQEKTKVVEDKDSTKDSPKQILDQVKTKMEPKNVKNNQTVKTGTKLSTYKNTSSQPNKQPVSNWSFNKKIITNMDNKAQMKLQLQDQTENSKCRCHIQDNSCNCSQKPTTLQKQEKTKVVEDKDTINDNPKLISNQVKVTRVQMNLKNDKKVTNEAKISAEKRFSVEKNPPVTTDTEDKMKIHYGYDDQGHTMSARERAKLVINRCEIFEKENPNFFQETKYRYDGEAYMVSKRYKLMLCYNCKVASTNQKRLLYALDNRYSGDLNNIKQTVARDYAKKRYTRFRKVQSSMKRYYKVMLIREPLERLLSAFRDERSYKSFFTEAKPKFIDYLQLVLDQKLVKMNRHTYPYYERCRPCEIKYDLVGLQRTFNDDMNTVLHTIHATHIKKAPKREETGYNSVTTDQLLKKYYSKIPHTMIHQLWEKFYKDYYIFGFPYPKHLMF